MNKNTEKPTWKTPPGTIIDGYNATPPSLNLKCIVFSIIVVLIYLFFPRNNNIVLCILGVLTVLGVLLYDKHYSCKKGSILRAIIAGILMVLFVKFVPAGNKLILLACLYLPYLIMAIYDHHFDCKRNKLGPTFLALFYSWAKPLYSDQIQIYKNWHPYWKDLISKFDYSVLAVLIVLSPFYFNKNFKLPKPLKI